MSALPEVDSEEQTDVRTSAERPWVTVVWNDPVNLMSYVSYVFRSYFGHPEHEAERLMMQVHQQGRAAVSVGSREKMEIDVQAMHSYGLWATMEQEPGS